VSKRLTKNDLPNYFKTSPFENAEVFLLDKYIAQCNETISSKVATINTLDNSLNLNVKPKKTTNVNTKIVRKN